MSLDVLKTGARRGPVISEYQRISASNAADIAVPLSKKVEDCRSKGASVCCSYAAFNSEISKRLGEIGSLRQANRDIVHRPRCRRVTRRTTMSFAIQHVHVKTKDPKQTMQFYIDNLGATYVAEIPGRGHRVNLHGLTLNITTLISAQNHEQHYGIEHIALDTDDYSGAMAKLRENGVRVLEELPPNNGRRVCFLEAPDGAQIELIEKVQPA
jgi:catechol 2,3-dioxygenase-like lactoylglutathione lyase family enzyme